jgi:hypothetical protein
MSDDRQQPNQRRQSVYSKSDVNSYERQFSAMNFTLVNGGSLISLAPIFDEFLNKEPKKGDNVYDYDEKMNFMIDAQAALLGRKGVQDLLADEDGALKSFTMKFGNEKSPRTFTIFKPNAIKLGGNFFGEFVLKLTQTKDDGEQKMFHIMQRATSEFKTADNDVIEDTQEIDMLLLVEFFNAVIDNAFGVSAHGAKRNGGGGSSYQSAGKKPARRAIEEDSEEGGEESSGKPSGKAGAKKTNLSDEFQE